MDNSKRLQLSYGAAKLVIRFLSAEQRTQLHFQVPYYHKTNALLPMILGEVELFEEMISILDRTYNFNFYQVDNEDEKRYAEHPELERQELEDHEQRRLERVPAVGRVNDPEERFIKLFDFYFKKGTIIRKLIVLGVPKFLQLRCHRDPSKWNFKVQELLLESYSGNLRKIVPFFHDSALKRMELILELEDIHFLEATFVKNCEILNLQVVLYHDGETTFINNIEAMSMLRNKMLILSHNNFKIEDVQRFALTWISTRRPIGTAFFACVDKDLYDSITQIFDRLIQENGARRCKIEKLGDINFANAVALKIDDKSDLVIFGDPRDRSEIPELEQEFTYFIPGWILRMEVMAVGDATILE